MAQHYTVLLIEDNPIAVVLARRLLEAAANEFDVVQVGTLAAGLERLAQGDIDLSLVDLGLPDSQGLDTLIAVLHQNPEVPAVVLTASEEGEHVFQAVQHGAQDYLVKGQFDGKTLLRSLRYALARHQAEQILKQEQSLAEVIFQVIGSAVMVLDPEGRILRFNRAWEKTTGYTAEDIWDQHFWALLFAPEEHQAMQELFEKLREQPQGEVYIHSWNTKGGQPCLIKWTSATLMDNQGRVLYVVIVGDRLPNSGGI
jgi:two-component system, cell cycle response regulator